jgi:hypothetical protein
VVLVMMAVGVVLIPVRASQLYSRLAARRITAGVLPRPAGSAWWVTGRRARPHLVVSGALSDVRGFNDWLQDCLMQVGMVGVAQLRGGVVVAEGVHWFGLVPAQTVGCVWWCSPGGLGEGAMGFEFLCTHVDRDVESAVKLWHCSSQQHHVVMLL